MTEQEQNAVVKNIETQLAEYKQALADYHAWMAAWRDRQPKGFRIRRKGA